MFTIALACFFLLDFLYYMVFLDVILSWLTLLWINLRPKFLSDIIDPIYAKIRQIIPTTFGMFDLTPIVVLFVIMFLKVWILIFFPWVFWILDLFK